MKVANLQKLPIFISSLLLILMSAGPAMADTVNKPYLKTFGADVMSGGWFSSGTSCSTDSSSDYQDPSFSSAALGLGTDNRSGGVITYAKQDASGNSNGGSSSQYAAMALGSVDGDNTINGFYSAGGLASTALTAKTLLTFANSSGGWGGIFEGNARQSNCLPDYYSKMPTSVNSSLPNLRAVVGNGSGSYLLTAGAGTNVDMIPGLGSLTIPAGVKITVYVNGNAYIDNNIVYGGGISATSIPKLVIVAKGSIYIDPSVTQLDGFYIAQPSTNAAAAINSDTGVIWTCHPNDQNPMSYTYPARFCGNKLTVNGALAAKQVNFLRTKGDIAAAPAPNGGGTEDTLSGGLSSNNIAEVINYTPYMVMGGSFFNGSPSNTASGLPIDSIFSLPPVF